ncbi:hypothetical protein [Marinobacter sp. F3R08]|uniref:hypothetical protein n=1 Tax=Marinobacter sp. F3R08 TaxID=2841559 RepID=UPI001C09D95F|nr:hypothetical protein [Marinobacter sp. F3R08]MBU2953326.1 hypothetical protein [Marinobacter sp. F3R08]
MYVKRNEHRIVAASEDYLDGFEEIDPTDPQLQSFLADKVDPDATRRFRESDSSLIRVIEDLVDLLSSKGIIRFTDLPPEAQKKLMERKSMRRDDDNLNLIDIHGDDLFDFD